IFVDPIDAHITLVSDPLPTIWHGIPLRLRSIGVDVDRPAFMLNPTDCSARQIGTTVLSTAGATAQLTHPFQARGCAGLRFAPKLGLRLTGKTQTTDGKHPGLNAVLTQAPGQAGTKSASVALPLSLALDPDNAQALCEFEAGLRVDCPATSIVGSATAVSPVLNRPLTGPVYFVKNVRIGRTGQPIRTLPTLLIPLRGEIALNLRANSSVESNKLVTTFPGVPDAPITRFELKIAGGRHGILVANTNICTASRRAVVQIDGQNGKRADTAPRLRMPCGTTSPALEVAKARWKGRVLRVSGRVGAKATKRVTVSMRCGAKTIRAAAKPRKGRWSAKLRCGAGRKVGRRLSLAYPGDSTYKAGRVQSSTPRRA
ncbi:MAG TPA: hypothetical protein VK631_26370, partial [Solirubrobacteraceae bacterium]|nr:hypothetical protein [Solirubrobacteraceae bacterium]